MSSYDNESRGSHKSAPVDEASEVHNLKLSIDLLSVRNMTMAANLFLAYNLELREVQSFQSQPPTAVSTTKGVDFKLTNTFASYEFQATKSQLFSILSQKELRVRAIHQVHSGQQSEIGHALVPLSKVLGAELKETPQAMVRVYDDFVDLRDPSTGHLKGNLRVIIYLEDCGVSPVSRKEQQTSLQRARDLKMGASASNMGSVHNFEGGSTGNPGGDYQAVWQLEMWKRAEEAKFKAYLKQREIEKIEEVTMNWKLKETDRETTFNEAMKNAETLETKLRQKGLDLQRREDRIIQLEDELKSKIAQVSRSLATKEEEMIGVKKRFKEEKNLLETEKKKALAQVDELKARIDQMDSKFLSFKMEVEQSPLNVLRNELAQKQIQLVEMETKVQRAHEERDEFRKKFEKTKQDMIALKKHIDREKELQLTKQAEELEQIKKQLRN